MQSADTESLKYGQDNVNAHFWVSAGHLFGWPNITTAEIACQIKARLEPLNMPHTLRIQMMKRTKCSAVSSQVNIPSHIAISLIQILGWASTWTYHRNLSSLFQVAIILWTPLPFFQSGSEPFSAAFPGQYLRTIKWKNQISYLRISSRRFSKLHWCISHAVGKISSPCLYRTSLDVFLYLYLHT